MSSYQRLRKHKLTLWFSRDLVNVAALIAKWKRWCFLHNSKGRWDNQERDSKLSTVERTKPRKTLPWFLKEWGRLDRAAFPPPARGRSWLHSAAASGRPSEQKGSVSS